MRRIVLQDWGEPGALHLALFDALANRLRATATSYVTVQWLQKNIPLKESSAEIWKAAHYFCGERIPLLVRKYELVRTDDSTEDIDLQEIDRALSGEPLYDPSSGEIVDDWDKHVSAYFAATPLLNELLMEPSE